MSPAPLRCRAGFTLIEVLVASAVAMVGVLGLLTVFPQAYDTARTSSAVTVLNHLALEKTESLRSVGYAHIDLALGTHPALATDSAGSYYYPVAGRPEDYSLRWIVTDGPTDGSGTPEPKMKTLVVEATYATRYTSGGEPITDASSVAVSFRTLLAE